MNFLTSWLFRLARSDLSSYFIGYAFEYASSLIPVRRLFEDRGVIAFIHPVPSWDIHYLVVPKRRIPTFASIDLTNRDEIGRILQVLQTAQALGRKSRLSEYTVLVNGGAYQDVPQLHFHVASDEQMNGVYADLNTANVDGQGGISSLQERKAECKAHPNPIREFHALLYCIDDTPTLWTLDFFDPAHRESLADLLRLAQEVVAANELERYTLLANVNHNQGETPLQFHLVSGAES